ncbi:MAG: PD40 domain-containing protein [Actinobacteria bacterium]|nr:PD40 domain-containing protein [Actinomycetota bacterium]
MGNIANTLTGLLDGSTQLTDYPVWSPDGQRIAFAGATSGASAQQIYVMNADGTNVSQLTHSVQNNIGGLAWSPDGKEIAFTKETTPNVGDIYAVDVVKGSERQITSSTADDRNPTWSPDGNYIAFQSNRGGKYDIYRVDAHPTTDGSEQGLADLTPGTDASNEVSPDYSPDGNSIMFASDRDNANYDVYMQPVSGTGTITRLTSAQGASPRFSPDGQKFVFVSTRSGEQDAYTQPLASDAKGNVRATDVSGSAGAVDHPDWQAVITTSSSPAASSSPPASSSPSSTPVDQFRGKPGCGPKKSDGFNASGYHMGPPGNGPGRINCPA